MVVDFTASFMRNLPELVGERLVVALSGGADSVALLRLMVAARDELGCSLTAVHVHHHARGADADADATFCAELCADLEVAFEHCDVGSVPPRGESREAFWRHERYRQLEEARVRHGCAAVLTAHTADDQAETVLIKLLRGSGPRGVAGIRRRHGPIARPLLDARRDALRRWLEGCEQDWREDATNASVNRPRGFVRHLLLPAVADEFPGVVEHLAAYARAVNEDETVLAGLLRAAGEWPDPRSPVSLAAVSSLPPPLRRRWVLELAARLPLAEPPSRRQLEQVETLLSGDQPSAVDLGRRWVLRRRGRKLLLSPPPAEVFPPIEATVPSRTSLPGGWLVRLGGNANPGADHRTTLAARVTGCRLVWRPARCGETWLDGGRLVDRLRHAGIPAEWRRAWPVLEASGTMIWVPAVGTVREWEGEEADGVNAELEEPWKRHARS